jgi:hypothetical protein
LYGGALHQQLQMQAMQQAAAQGAAPNKKPDSTKTKEAPITGESDVQESSSTVH